MTSSSGGDLSIRTTVSEVTFNRSFKLPDMDNAHPPGTYRVETDEELLAGISFLAYRRVATRLHLRRPGLTEVLTVDPRDLDLALGGDGDALDEPHSSVENATKSEDKI
jgi:hypothetical protein